MRPVPVQLSPDELAILAAHLSRHVPPAEPDPDCAEWHGILADAADTIERAYLASIR